MRLLVVGAGATGGYFGGRLAQAGRDVTFLVRPGRAAQLQRDGLQILSPHGDATIAPKLVTAGQIDGAYDAVLLTVKAWGLEGAMEDLAPAIGPGSVILPVLNGMRHMDILRDRLGAEALGGCVCKVATTLDAEGRIRQLAPLQDLAYGELDGAPSARMAALDGLMQGAGFTARLSPVIETEMWEKWLMLASLGGITCLMRGHLGHVGAAPGGTAFISAFLDEVEAAIAASGIPPRPEVAAGIRKQFTAPGSTQASSMYRDLVQGLPVEAESIIGDLVRRAQAKGLSVPLLAASWTHLAVYQAQRPG